METKWIIAIAFIAILIFYFYPVSGRESSVNAEVTVVYKDGSTETFTGNPLDNLFKKVFQAITLPGDTRQVDRFIIKLFFQPYFTGTVTQWDFKAEASVWLFYDTGDEEMLEAKTFTDSGSSLANGQRVDVGSFIVMASTIEQKLNNRNAQEGEYALILKLKYARLSVTFDTGVSDSYEITPASPINIFTLNFNYTGDKIDRVDVGGDFSVSFTSLVKPVEEVMPWT